MSEPYLLSVCRRDGQLYVCCSVLDEVAYCDLGEAWAVTADVSSLALVLGEAERAALEAIAALPRSERGKGPGFWERLGFKTWNEFARGASECSIIRSDERTRIRYAAWDGAKMSLSGAGIQQSLPPSMSLHEIAALVLDIFARSPAPGPDSGEAKRKRGDPT